MKNPVEQFEKQDKNRKDDVKIVWIGDLHIPFHKVDMIEKIFHEHKGAYLCVIGGDLLDAFGISSFRKESYVSLLEEYIIACEIVEKASEYFDWVVLLQGNHEARWERQVLSKLPIEAYAMANQGLLKRIADGHRYDRKKEVWTSIGVMPNVVCPMKKTGEVDWFYQVGQTIFAHPEKFSKIYGRAVQYAEEFFHKQGYSFDSIVMGHTHKLVQIYTLKTLMIEAGCLREEANYGMSPRLSYSPQTNGYAVVYQDKDGNTNFHETKAIYLAD